MVNMKIFKTLLECAYDLNVTHFFSRVEKFHSDSTGHSFRHVCDINTEEGGLHISLHEAHYDSDKYINADIKTSIKSVTAESVVELVKMQLETEAFLGHDDYKSYRHECNLLN
ncbi:hypothetical protein PQ478_09435 [Alkalihalophilus pseudofirmus]|uniref:hypothetical protein n=1 Tax=Alkalihalophilus pseudofirmus TaxID=79885 RepID=UPI00259B83B4|nr:hypothetical protein [Alkalihalophilus pseudofirmus]WEG18690.1 hypothetical protein PQ478_09435 [Alkalihalophilus pseudofirmus]